ncbi:MAG TPA: serine hydroxymethyltransferase, partial [Patescibacteria group bacterium]|nr:serine hydroxymethyltransferase [Patescibacteria group bacterium]
NMIPFDPRKPLDPSGIRLGTPALTTRGAKEADMETAAELMDNALQYKDSAGELGKIKQQVREFSLKFPVPGIE